MISLTASRLVLRKLSRANRVQNRLINSQRTRRLRKNRPHQRNTDMILRRRNRRTFSKTRRNTIGRRQALVNTILHSMLGLRALKRIRIRLSNQSLPDATSNIANLRKSLQTMRNNPTQVNRRIRIKYLNSLARNANNLLPSLIKTSMLVQVLNKRLRVRIKRARILRRVRRRNRRTNRLILRLLTNTMSIKVILDRTARANRTVSLTKLLMTMRNARLRRTRQRLAMKTLTQLRSRIIRQTIRQLRMMIRTKLNRITIHIMLLIRIRNQMRTILMPIRITKNLMRTTLNSIQNLRRTMIILTIRLTQMILRHISRNNALQIRRNRTKTSLIQRKR